MYLKHKGCTIILSRIFEFLIITKSGIYRLPLKLRLKLPLKL